VRPVFKVMLRWALSPIGSLLYTGMLVTVLVIAGVDAGGPSFWLPVAIFVGVSAFYDISAYVVQRRKGLTWTEVSDAVFERLWPSREEGAGH
jgi:hypothetical protein